MHPILFNAGPVTIYSYGVLLASAYLLGPVDGRQARARRRHRRQPDHGPADLGDHRRPGRRQGAAVRRRLQHFTSSWQEFTTLLRSGGVFYGGLIAAIVVCIWQLRKHRLPLWSSGDLFAPGIALGYMVGRLGCLMAGCCYGKPTDVAWAITFTDPAANFNVGTPLNVPLHPTQLYESAAGLVILIAVARCSKSAPAISPAARSGASRSSTRCCASSSNSSAATIAAWCFNLLSTSQFISVVLAPLSLFMLWYLSRLPARPSRSRPRAA